MRSQDSEQQTLNAIETQLRRDDPGLALCFIAFSQVTRNVAMPPSEQWTEGLQVGCGRRRRGWMGLSHRLRIQLIMLFVVGMTLFFAVPEAISWMS